MPTKRRISIRGSGLRSLATKAATDALERLAPGTVQEIRLRDRLSVWHRTAQSTGVQSVWGYVNRHSIDPGGAFELMLAGGPRAPATTGRVEIFRIGYEDGADRRLMWTSERLTVEPYEATREGLLSPLLDGTAAALGPNWPAALRITETSDWTSGYYSVDFVDTQGQRDADVAFIVVTDPRRSGDVLVKLATATYQAYNKWGGHSLYDDDGAEPLAVRGRMVSFDRPTRSEFWEWEYFFVLWLESLAKREGFSVSYATGFDLAREAWSASDYELLVVPGHDEYWSKEEFDRIHDRIFHLGRNTLFLSANIAYWQVRYVDVNAFDGGPGRQLVCHKSVHDPISHHVDDPELHVTARFRDGARRPETMLLGIGYQSNFADRAQLDPVYPYHVNDDELPFFSGTGYQKGDPVAATVGHEWDNRDPEAEYPAPGEPRIDALERLWDPDRSRIEPIPLESIRIAFSSDGIVDTLGRKGRAEAVYFESDAGARVFSAGTIRWTWGLGKEGYADERFARLNRNLVLDFLGRGVS